jgi:hypothetical protein
MHPGSGRPDVSNIPGLSSPPSWVGLGQSLSGPKVSFASQVRWGTEPEGWYVDHPDAVLRSARTSPFLREANDARLIAAVKPKARFVDAPAYASGMSMKAPNELGL